MDKPISECSPKKQIIVAILVTGALLIGLAVAPGFVRSRPNPSKNACINNLRQIDGGKEQWALENKLSAGTPSITKQVNEYIKGNATPICEQGGKYTYGNIGEPPTCTFKGHTL